MNQLRAACAVFLLSMGFAHGQSTVRVCTDVVQTAGGIPVTSCQDVTGANPLPSGLDSGSSPWQTVTPANSSHAAGTSVGGLFSVPMARSIGGSGIITNVMLKSVGGSTGTYLVRLWDVKPVNSTCTDNTAFAGSAVDDEHLVAIPFSLTAAAPANTTGDSSTYASSTGLTIDYRNQDAVATKNVYACLVTTATDTSDDGAAIYLNLTGTQN